MPPWLIHIIEAIGNKALDRVIEIGTTFLGAWVLTQFKKNKHEYLEKYVG